MMWIEHGYDFMFPLRFLVHPHVEYCVSYKHLGIGIYT
jgi:hypothetical protein